MKNFRTLIFLLVYPAILLLFFFANISNPDSSKIVKAANTFIKELNQDQRAKAVKDLKDENFTVWTYLPPYSVPRQGLPLKEMNEKQRKLAHALLGLCLSEAGHDKVKQIMGLEEVLRILEGNEKRDAEMYFVTVFNSPDAKGPWAWRFEGHHLSLHFNFAGGNMRFTPQFLGTNPAEVREGPKKGLRVLKNEQDIALELLHSLDENQRKKTVFANEAFKDIITTSEPEVKPLDKVGISFSELNKNQQTILLKLIDEYISVMPADVAKVRKDRFEKAGKDNIMFGWAGEDAYNKPHYYRIQGPTFLIEFDNTQNNANHVHSVWRDFNGDFGRDIIREHYESSDHHH